MTEFAANSMQYETEDDNGAADTQLERASEALRELVLRGTFPLEVKLPEARVAELLGVSRTPARLAMAALEKDGLLVRMPRRGFRVRRFSLDEVVEAVEVRGELEAVAARVVAERGIDADNRAQLEACIGRAEHVIDAPVVGAKERRDWCAMNGEFHDVLVAACNIRPLQACYAQVNRTPLASPRDIMFNVADAELCCRQLVATHEDHMRVLAAILERKSTRAAALMREHAYRSGENKRRNFRDLDRTIVVETPGAALITVTGEVG